MYTILRIVYVLQFYVLYYTFYVLTLYKITIETRDPLDVIISSFVRFFINILEDGLGTGRSKQRAHVKGYFESI